MACGNTTSELSRHVVSATTVVVIDRLTTWTPCVGVDKVVAVLKKKNEGANLTIQLVAQYAAIRTNAPGAPTALGSVLATSEDCTGAINISTATAENFFMRFGLQYASTSGLSQGDVSLQMTWNACGRVVGSQTADLLAVSTTAAFRAITGWMPTLGVDAVKAAIILSSVIGSNFQVKLVYRLAETSTEVPGAWTAAETGTHSGAGEYPVGDQALTLDGSMWVQFGIQYLVTSGSFGGATVATTVAVRKT